jgi:hypothetical protein
MLSSITLTDLRTLVNLKNIGNYSLKQELLDFIKHDRSNIIKPYHSIIGLSLYEGAHLKDSNYLYIDEDLNVISTVDLDIRKTYRLRLYIVLNIDNLPDKVTNRIREYSLNNPIFANRLHIAMNCMLSDLGGYTDIKSSHVSILDQRRLGFIGHTKDYSNNPVSDIMYNPNDTRYVSSQIFFINTKD